MIRILTTLFLCVAITTAAQAQPRPETAMPSAAHAAPSAPASSATTTGVTAAQAQAALEVLTNDAKRAEFIATLQTIVKAQGGVPAATPATGSATAAAGAPAAAPASGAAAAGTPSLAKLAIPLAPDSLGAEILVGASQRLSSLSTDMVSTAQAVTDFPLLSRWFRRFVTDPDSQAALADAAWKLAVVLGAGLVIEAIVRRLLRRPARSLEGMAPDGRKTSDDEPAVSPAPDHDAGEPHRRRPSALVLLRRLPIILGCFVLDIIPTLLVLAVGYLLLGTALGDPGTTRLVVLAVLNAYVLCRLITSVVRMLVAPDAPRLRLFHISDDAAAYLLRWTRRIAVVAIFGYALTEVALLFGLYRIAHDAVLKVVALAVHIMLIVVVLQTRGKVARRIRARPGAKGVRAVFRNRLAATWHWIAIFYIAALWLVWAFEVPNGFTRLVHFFVASVLILTVARLIGIAAVGAVDRALRVGPELSQRYPGLEARARSYNPIARVIVSSLVTVLAVVALFEAWGIDSLSWFTADALGTRLLSAGGMIAITLLLALAVWELVNAAIQRHLNRLAREAQIARSARLRTLLPMLRTTLFAAICLFAGLMVLSQIGVNIAPLLAGAGVVGLAIGFGSQKLVQDIITGLFLLLENAMQVGDVVSLGGLSGTVENLSIRTIRLRALDGSVHIVPFSAVTTVTNMTRDFGYALIDVSVGLNEDPDRIADLLRDLVRDMRAEDRWASALRDELEVMGVEKFIDLAVVLRVRVKTLPGQRWAVGRELNRRIKKLFDDLAIESPFTSHRVLSEPLAPAPAPRPAEPVSPPAESPA